MLAKLMKYEVKATARWFLPLYGTILIFALINRFTLYSPFMVSKYNNQTTALFNESLVSTIKGIVSSLFMLIYVMLFVGIFVATLIVVIQRYYKSLLGDEGYLMFTLPVNTWQHILNKLIISMLWCFLSSIVAFGSILILIPKEAIAQIPDAFGKVKELIGMPGIFLLALCIITGLILSILKIYAAISLGHLFNKHRLLLSFAMYLGLDAITQFVWMLLIILVTKVISKGVYLSNAFNFNIIFGSMAILGAILSVVHFFLTSFLIKRKLNLE